MQKDIISVIIPTYRREKEMLQRAIESVKKQTYSEHEIIIIDDNIADSYYRKEIESYMKTFTDDLSVVYIQNEKTLGGALSRNRGVEESTGLYITFLDDDDKYLKEKLEHQIDYMKNINCDFSFSDLIIMNENEKILDYRSFEDLKDFSNDSLLKYHLKNHITGTPTFMIKKECFTKIDGFENVPVGQEYHLMLKAIEANLNIKYLERCDVVAYKHDGAAISKGNNKIIGEKQLYNFKKKYFNLLDQKDIKYIKFRHYAVLSVTYFKKKSYINSISYMFLILLTTPMTLGKEAIRMFMNRKKIRN